MSVSAAKNVKSRRAEIEDRLRKTKPINLPGYHQRLVWVWLLLFLGQFGLIGRLIWLQANQGSQLQQKARAQRTLKLAPKMARHPIVDRNGNLLAKDEPTFRLFVHPVMFKKTNREMAAALAPIVKLSEDALMKLFESGKSGIPVASNISEAQAGELRKLNLDGFDLDQEWHRAYPQKDLMSSIVGYVDAEHKGQAGLEYSLQSWLQAQPSLAPVSEDGNGYLLPDRFPLRPLNAEELSLKLTLDTRLQWSATTALHKKLKQYNALRGAVMVMDVKDGSLLALVSEPSFDPATFYKADPALFRNWAIADLYEPGSTFKPINVAIALEAGAIQPDTVVYDEGHISVGGWPIQNNDGSAHGAISITKVLEVSSNIGMVHIMERVKRSTYFDFLKKIGIGELTGTDMPFETAGSMKDRAQFIDYPIEAATNSFGQGFSVTPIQMVQLHAAIANGGKMVTPHVTQGLFDPNGKLTSKTELTAPRRVFSEATTASVRKMMASVVEHGTGQPAKIPGYRLGGKTGTAQKAGGGTYRNARITSFVATFPAESPQYVVFAVVDEPKGDDAFGSTVAAPIVKSVIETLISIEGIPPSHPNELGRPAASSKPQ
ncbi:peptidoglycan D,D-transpeptidase FtsI family protein [Altericista sp. CCNU0014]|uniref:peptidoglycan D,D-transpeptidase FtsI family protein n=1 Tax=Altericista sp. CCNU0014 TaxID=3082949 RepID=UPI00384B99EF